MTLKSGVLLISFLMALPPLLGNDSITNSDPLPKVRPVISKGSVESTSLFPKVGSQHSFLIELSSDLLADMEISELSVGVFRIRTQQSYDVVLRLEGFQSDIGFEKFAADFFQAAPTVKSPATLIIKMPDSLLTRLVAFTETSRSSIRKKQQSFLKSYQDNGFTVASLTIFIEGKSGEDHIYEYVDEYSLRSFEELWPLLPEKLRIQLADHWALHELLGVWDFHNLNWLHCEDVVSIDFSLRSDQFNRGAVERSPNSREPVFGNLIKPHQISQLKSELSPDMRHFILSLDRHQIDVIAGKSGFHISEAQMRGILRRAEIFLSHE